MTHDYKRNGTTTLFAALDILHGTVIGRCITQHRHQEFIRFLAAIERAVPAGKVIHAILDNYATHKHPRRAEVARQSSALDLPLHADISLVAERGRRLLLDDHAPKNAARGLQIRAPTRRRNRPLHQGTQQISQAIRLDQDRKSNLRQNRRGS